MGKVREEDVKIFLASASSGIHSFIQKETPWLDYGQQMGLIGCLFAFIFIYIYKLIYKAP